MVEQSGGNVKKKPEMQRNLRHEKVKSKGKVTDSQKKYWEEEVRDI